MAGRLSPWPAAARRRRRSAGRIALSRLSRGLGDSLSISAPAAERMARPPSPPPPRLARALAALRVEPAALAATWSYRVRALDLSFEALVDEAVLQRALAGGELRLFVPAKASLLARLARRLERLFGPPPERGRRRQIRISVRGGEAARLMIDEYSITPSEENDDDQREKDFGACA